MKKRVLLLILLGFILPGIFFAQQISPFVISTSGGFYNNDSGMLSFTTGEMVAVETLSSPGVTLTQGFQQYWDLGTYIVENADRHFSFNIYPNLSNGIFNLVTESDLNESIDARILDVLGKEIFLATYYHLPGTTIEPIDISNSPPGMYVILLQVKRKQPGTSSHFIRKIQLIK